MHTRTVKICVERIRMHKHGEDKHESNSERGRERLPEAMEEEAPRW